MQGCPALHMLSQLYQHMKWRNNMPCLMNATNPNMFCNCGMANLVPTTNVRTMRQQQRLRNQENSSHASTEIPMIIATPRAKTSGIPSDRRNQRATNARAKKPRSAMPPTAGGRRNVYKLLHGNDGPKKTPRGKVQSKNKPSKDIVAATRKNLKKIAHPTAGSWPG